MEKKSRIFIAFPVSLAVKQELQKIEDWLKKHNKRASVKWTDIETVHLTLYFIGELSQAQIERVKEILQTATRGVAPIAFSLRQLDAFPNHSRPKVVTVRVWEEGPPARLVLDSSKLAGEAGREAKKLRQKIVSELNRACITGDDKPWKPHLTLGRNRTNQAVRGLDRVIEPTAWTAESVELIESELEVDGPIYTVLQSFPLV